MSTLIRLLARLFQKKERASEETHLTSAGEIEWIKKHVKDDGTKTD